VDEEFMFAKSADPATMEEVQVLLEDSVKGSIPPPNILCFPVVKEIMF
jgi:hypothetical protein